MQTELFRGKSQALKSASKREYFWSHEKRRYVRYPSGWRIRLANFAGITPKSFLLGKCKNLSQDGMKIACLESLEREATVLLEVDLNLLAKYIKVDRLLQVKGGRILAEVKWRHLNLDTGLFEAGLKFIAANRAEEYETFIARANDIP